MVMGKHLAYLIGFDLPLNIRKNASHFAARLK